MKPLRIACLLALVTLMFGCGSTTSGEPSASKSPSSSSPSPTSSFSATQAVYTDSDYEFTVTYLEHFQVWPLLRGNGTNEALKTIRIADKKWPPETYAGGGVVIRVYPRDADTPTSWVRKHQASFFDDVEKLNATTFQSYQAASFEQNHPQEGFYRGKTIVFFREQLVYTFFGWTATAEYWSTIEPIWTAIMNSHRAT